MNSKGDRTLFPESTSSDQRRTNPLFPSHEEDNFFESLKTENGYFPDELKNDEEE